MQDGREVVHELSIDVTSGERVGIGKQSFLPWCQTPLSYSCIHEVGRTGSGKSSLTLALLRCILTEGVVRYDGLPTDKINLDALRSNITIIPQVVSCYRAHGPLAASTIMIRL